MSDLVQITSVTVQRGIADPTRASDTATVIIQTRGLIAPNTDFSVRLDVSAQGRNTREIIDQGRKHLLARIESLGALLQELDSFLPPDWT